MGFLDKAKQMATKENLEKLKTQAQSKLDQAQDKMGTSQKAHDERTAQAGQAPTEGQPSQQPVQAQPQSAPVDTPAAKPGASDLPVEEAPAEPKPAAQAPPEEEILPG